MVPVEASAGSGRRVGGDTIGFVFQKACGSCYGDQKRGQEVSTVIEREEAQPGQGSGRDVDGLESWSEGRVDGMRRPRDGTVWQRWAREEVL